MQTKVTLKDAVVAPECFAEFSFRRAYGAEFCKTCRYGFMENEDRCNDCRPRLLPPTRWREINK